MPLTDAQRSALPFVRAMFQSVLSAISTTAQSVELRAQLPAPETLPSDLNVHVEIAPPSSHPYPILQNTGALKTPERVPIYFFTLADDTATAEVGLDPGPDVDLENTRVIFFIHGGGNVIGHPTGEFLMQYYVHLLRAVTSNSRSATGVIKCVIAAPSYRLATVPDNAFPAALQDLVAAYDHVLSKGYKPSNIVIAGDSAGGNHAVVLTHLILESGKLCPRGVVPIAPGSIQTNDLLSDYAKTFADRDTLTLPLLERSWSAYIGTSGAVPTDPLVSGSFIPFTAAWPKTLILVGNADLLIDASRELERRLAAVKVPVEIVEYDERPHGWWVIPHLFLEDIRDSAERIARFVLH